MRNNSMPISSKVEQSPDKTETLDRYQYGQPIIRGSSKGRTQDFDSCYLGSNPSPRANLHSDVESRHIR